MAVTCRPDTFGGCAAPVRHAKAGAGEAGAGEAGAGEAGAGEAGVGDAEDPAAAGPGLSAAPPPSPGRRR